MRNELRGPSERRRSFDIRLIVVEENDLVCGRVQQMLGSEVDRRVGFFKP